MQDTLLGAGRSSFISITSHPAGWIEPTADPRYRSYRAQEAWTPAINVYECDRQHWIVMDLAGLCAEEINIHVEGRRLIIEGHRPAPQLPPDTGRVCLHLMEIDHGRFERVLELPENVDVDAIEATYRRGYLWIRIPKKP